MKYIATFFYIHKFANFALTELLSIIEMLKIKNFKFNNDFSYNIKSEPYITISFDDIENEKLCNDIISRSVFIKNIVLVYSDGETMDDVVNNINKNDLQSEIDSELSFKYDIDIRRENITQSERLSLMNKLTPFKFKAKANLSSPERTFVIFQHKSELTNKTYTFFGKQICGKDSNKRFYNKFDLIHRKYLGPTSTNHILSFIMSNFAQVKENDFVIDPFVGTGSLLIPPSYFGAFVYGCDLDIRVLKGFSVGYVRKEKKIVKKEADIFSNFDDYQLQRPQIIRQDINHPSFKRNLVFDAIICDPPYGYRACSKKTGTSQYKKEKREHRLLKRLKEKEKLNGEEKEKEKEEANEEEGEEEFNPEYVFYGEEKRLFLPLKKCDISQIFISLINFANDCLRKGGLLVCLYPHKREKEEENAAYLPIGFPQHKSFKLLHACNNGYSLLKGRWCLVYKKIE